MAAARPVYASGVNKKVTLPLSTGRAAAPSYEPRRVNNTLLKHHHLLLLEFIKLRRPVRAAFINLFGCFE